MDENNTIEEKLLKSYYIILCLIAFKQSTSEDKRDSDLQYIFNLMALKPTEQNSSRQHNQYRGVTVDELTSILSGVFGYWHIILNDFVTRKALSHLLKEGLIEEQTVEGKYYYFISESLFKDFVIDCTGFYWDIQFRYRIMWQTIRPPKYKERMFFNLFYKDDINKSIEHFKSMLRQKKLDPNYKKLIKQNKDLVDTFDNSLNERYKNIKRNYSELFERYPALVNIVLDVFYPKFI